MKREEAKELFKKASDFAVHYSDYTDVVSLCQVDIILNEIFDEHEAQLKAKDEEIAKYQMAIDRQSKRAEALKQLSLDKDAEIAMTKERHRLEHERYLINEAIIKEKDAEIKNARGVIEWHEKECKNYIKLHHQKSRSIVAMLFWEWREADNSYKKSRTEKPKPTEKTISLRGMRASQCERLFKQAYKMLKDNA